MFASEEVTVTSSTKIHGISGRIMPVNAYVVEGADGLVIVDGMLTLTDARAVRTELERLGKPILGAVVTHAHPDHYAGLAEILRGQDVPVVSTPAVRRAIERDDALKNEIVGPMMGGEWPSQRIFPTTDVEPGSTLRFADIAFEVVDLGPAESPADSLYRLDARRLFVGDVVYAGMHAYLADGFADEWLACLDRLERELEPDATLYVGHGAPGGLALLGEQRRYVQAFMASVERHLGKSAEQRRQAVVADMKRILATEDLAFLMELSVDPFAMKLEASGAGS
jgi:glyoxylase-like metal-dependent hydrolase (beta-lactamase superfamily II)